MKWASFCLCLLAVSAPSWAFKEEAIFEDEDIYTQALPPDPNKALTAPGTKWCGPGSTAANYEDLGSQRDTDICCRAHDHCEHIDSGDSLHGIVNTDWFPIMQCSCEQNFLNCLQSANTTIARALGRIYFSARSKCYDYGHPIQSCKQYQISTFMRRCVVYRVDGNRDKRWQLYDTPLFSIPKK